jgi:hypothetical protein
LEAAPLELREYLDRLLEQLDGALGSDLAGAYLIGSAALGAYRPGRSDVDVYAVTRDLVPSGVLRRVAADCSHGALPCPARKLELVVIPAAEVREPSGQPRWQLNLNTGAGLDDHAGLEPGEEPAFWFVLDLALAHSHAVALRGPAAAELVGAPDAAEVARAQAHAVAWYAEHEPGPGAVVAACRAWLWHETGRFAAKGDAVRWAFERL